jgi:hypothetical protein
MDVLGLLVVEALTKDWASTPYELAVTTLESAEVPDQQVSSQPPMESVIPIHQLESLVRAELSTFPQSQSPDTAALLESSSTAPEDAEEEEETVRGVFLTGEAVWGISGVAGRDTHDPIGFQGSVELLLNASFTGQDQLEIGLESGNATDPTFVEDEITFEGRLSDPSGTDDNRFELSELSYEFPVNDSISLYLSATGDDLDDFNPVFGDSGAISEFGSENPIHDLVEDVGVQVNSELSDNLSASLGYFGAEADPEAGIGPFNSNYSAFAQLGFEVEDWLVLGLTYIHTYNDSSLETETGSLRSQLDLERPIIGNSYGVSASFAPSERVAIGGWVGVTRARVLGLGDAEVWNYALTLAFPDLGREGNLLGFVLGQEPRLTGTSGFTVDDLRRDPDTSLHLEAFYSNRISEQISITPGLVWITAPNHDTTNPDILVFTVRTTFEF